MPDTLSVIIPTLNEAARLPALFKALERQNHRPDQIVIADAGSTDDTRLIAQGHGAVVTEGGKPAVGRNRGAVAATSDLLLFLDADVELDDDFIAKALQEFGKRRLVVATSFVEPIERDTRNIFVTDVVNLYLDVMQYMSPHAPGFCILIQRQIHEAISGFNETVVLAEDHDYVQRAAARGKFRVLRTAMVSTSMRRIEKEGLVRLAFKYLYCELYVVTGRPIRKVPFEYEFGAFDSEDRSAAQQAISAMRERLSTFAEAVLTASGDGLDSLRRLGPAEGTYERILHELGADELRRLRRYVNARLHLTRPRPTPRRAASPRHRVAGIWPASRPRR